MADENDKPRVVGKPFPKGYSPARNAGGRPRSDAVVKAIGHKQSPKSMRWLVRTANDPATKKSDAIDLHRWIVETFEIDKATIRLAGAHGEPLVSPRGLPPIIEALLARAAAQGEPAATEPPPAAEPAAAPPSANGEAGRPS